MIFDTPMRLWRAGFSLSAAQARLAAAAAEVIMRRSALIAVGGLSAPEAARMMIEKPSAFAEAGMRAGAAAMLGENAVGVATAALRPLNREAGANLRRLRR